jgi:hypothetical protein
MYKFEHRSSIETILSGHMESSTLAVTMQEAPPLALLEIYKIGFGVVVGDGVSDTVVFPVLRK